MLHLTQTSLVGLVDSESNWRDFIAQVFYLGSESFSFIQLEGHILLLQWVEHAVAVKKKVLIVFQEYNDAVNVDEIGYPYEAVVDIFRKH